MEYTFLGGYKKIPNMEKILQDSTIIAEMVANEEVKIVSCMYDLESGVVDFYD